VLRVSEPLIDAPASEEAPLEAGAGVPRLILLLSPRVAGGEVGRGRARRRGDQPQNAAPRVTSRTRSRNAGRYDADDER
jgi:hypothetical protein